MNFSKFILCSFFMLITCANGMEDIKKARSWTDFLPKKLQEICNDPQNTNEKDNCKCIRYAFFDAITNWDTSGDWTSRCYSRHYVLERTNMLRCAYALLASSKDSEDTSEQEINILMQTRDCLHKTFRQNEKGVYERCANITQEYIWVQCESAIAHNHEKTKKLFLSAWSQWFISRK